MQRVNVSRALGLTAAALIGSSTLGAQIPSVGSTRLVHIGFGGGVIVPRTGASVNSLKTGTHGQGFLLFQLPGLPAVRANFDYSKLKFENPTLPGGGTAQDADRTELSGVASMKVDLVRGPVRPYLLAGVGAYNIKDVVENASSGPASYSDTNFGLDGGAGIAFKLWSIEGFVESRIQNVYTKTGGLIDQKQIQSFPVTFGFVF
jgi:opacity protein-like surface antigen